MRDNRREREDKALRVREMNEIPKLFVPSWDELYALLIKIAKNVRSQYSPELIIGVARGGLVPARVLSDLLDCHTLGTIGVAFYDDIGQRRRTPTVTQLPSVAVEGRRVLVVDDIADTGESLSLVVSELRKACDLKTATVFRKPWSHLRPDFSARETDAWVIFPWELCESVRKIGRRLLDSGRTLTDVENQLVQAGVNRDLAAAFLKEVQRKPQI